MPPAVLADSDDEGESFECEDHVASSRGSRSNAGENAKDRLDAADDSSTGSTERLRRQIQSAERGLLSNSAPITNLQLASSESPARHAAKRRHTAAFASEGNVSPEKAVKRTKTLKTYGGSRRQIETADDSNFDHFHEDHGSSQSMRFSEHSGHPSSVPLPAGSLQDDFLNHEPAVMFKDTSDTVADASSEQQRLLEQAIAGKKGLSTSVVKEAQQNSQYQSSSIPWTASDNADSAKSKRSRSNAEVDSHKDETKDGFADAGDGPTSRDVEASEEAPAENTEEQRSSAENAAKAMQKETNRKRPKSSPMVEIYPEQYDAPVDDGVGKTKRQNTKSRDRKSEEEEGFEPLNSEDQATGLPKEEYKPRPSRRRATQIVEDPNDYSVRPEKAAKVKRTKTAGANTSFTTDEGNLTASQDSRPGVSPSGLSKDGLSGDARKSNGDGNNKQTAGKVPKSEDDTTPVKPRRSIDQEVKEPSSSKESQPAIKAPPDTKDSPAESEDKIFVKPAIPKPKPKNLSKAKRAQTTIFEDHVESIGSRRSPNLRQQQAKRRSALQDVKNEAGPKTERKRKSVTAEDSDDEDELAKENDDPPNKAHSPPKKRRGRPPKSEKHSQAKKTDSVGKEADGRDEEAEPDKEQSEAEEPPMKRGRGRPAKSAIKLDAGDAKDSPANRLDDEAQKDAQQKDVQEEDVQQEDSDDASKPAAPPASTPSKPNTPATEMPTPSPEKPAEKATPSKSAPTVQQHSPIKSSSKVPFRVGLSKKSRIPSLLRITRPPKR